MEKGGRESTGRRISGDSDGSTSGTGASIQDILLRLRKLEVGSNGRDSSSSEFGSEEGLGSYLQRRAVFCIMTKAGQLERTWDELGTSGAGRKKCIDKLLDDVGKACEARVDEEMGYCEAVRQGLRKRKEELVGLMGQLGALPQGDTAAAAAERLGRDPSFFFAGAEQAGAEVSSLHGQLTWLEIRYEALAKQAEERKRRLEKVQREIHALCDCMTREVDKSFDDFDASIKGALEGAGGEEEVATGLLRQDVDLSDARIAACEEHLKLIRGLAKERERVVVDLVLQCQDHYRTLKRDPSLPLDFQVMGSLCPSSVPPKLRELKSSPHCVGLSKWSVQRLTKLLAELKEEVEHRTERSTEQRKEISELFDLLDTTVSKRVGFSRAVTGIGFQDMELIQDTLDELRAEKRRSAPQFIDQIRAEVQALLVDWGLRPSDVLGEGAPAILSAQVQSRRAVLQDVQSGPRDGDGELLAAHEALLKELRTKKEAIDNVTSLMKRRESLLVEKSQEEKVNYKEHRGTTLSEQVKRIDSVRKRVKQVLPQVSSALTAALLDWETQYGSPFLAEGQRVLSLLEEDPSLEGMKTVPGARKDARPPTQRKESSGTGGFEGAGRVSAVLRNGGLWRTHSNNGVAVAAAAGATPGEGGRRCKSGPQQKEDQNMDTTPPPVPSKRSRMPFAAAEVTRSPRPFSSAYVSSPSPARR